MLAATVLAVQSVGAAELPTAAEASAAVKSSLCGTIWSLAPALLAIVLALIFKEVYSALFAGVVLGACFVTQFSPLETVDFVVNTGLIEGMKNTTGVFIFLVILGAFVCMINKTGATRAFGLWAQTHSNPASAAS